MEFLVFYVVLFFGGWFFVVSLYAFTPDRACLTGFNIMLYIDVIVLLVLTLPFFIAVVAVVFYFLWLIVSCPFKCIKMCCCPRRPQADILGV